MLIAGQVLGGAATAAGIAVATILARDLLGGDALAGLAFAGSTFGAAAAAVPLSRRTARFGRRAGLVAGYAIGAAGALLCIVAAELEVFPVLLVGLFLFGAGNAANLLARYAAADLAPPERRARSISLVVFATTVGSYERRPLDPGVCAVIWDRFRTVSPHKRDLRARSRGSRRTPLAPSACPG